LVTFAAANDVGISCRHPFAPWLMPTVNLGGFALALGRGDGGSALLSCRLNGPHSLMAPKARIKRKKVWRSLLEDNVPAALLF